MKILIQDQHGVRKLEEGYASEQELQVFLRDHSDLIPVDEIELGTPPLLCIGWEVSVASGTEDLLYVDETGLLTIVETKLRRNPQARREVVGQILEYAAQASTWSPKDVELRAQKFFSSQDCPQEYRGKSLEDALRYFLQRTESAARESFSHEDFLNLVSSNLERGHIRLVIAIDEPPEPLLRIVEFVNRFSERFEIYLIQLKRFHDRDSGQNIFVPALFGRVATTQRIRQPEEWDWEKYETKLGWTEKDVQEAQYLLDRLQRTAQGWEIETRFHQGWIDVRCYGRVRFGVAVSRLRGVELFFWMRESPEEELPEGVTARQTKEMLFLSGALETLDEATLGHLCEITLKQPEQAPQANG